MGSLSEQLYSDGSPSKLSQPIGIQAQRDRDARDRGSKNEEQEYRKRARLANRQMRSARRTGDHAGAMKAYDWLMEHNGNTGAGIRKAGVLRSALDKRFDDVGNAIQGGGGRRTANPNSTPLERSGRAGAAGEQPAPGSAAPAGTPTPSPLGLGNPTATPLSAGASASAPESSAPGAVRPRYGEGEGPLYDAMKTVEGYKAPAPIANPGMVQSGITDDDRPAGTLSQQIEDMREAAEDREYSRGVLKENERLESEMYESVATKAEAPDNVAQYRQAYEEYQRGDGSPNSAYGEEAFNRMEAFRKQASPEEQVRMMQIQGGGTGEVPIKEGSYAGSDAGRLKQYNSLSAARPTDPAAIKARDKELRDVYAGANSLDKAGMTASVLRSARKTQEINQAKTKKPTTSSRLQNDIAPRRGPMRNRRGR